MTLNIILIISIFVLVGLLSWFLIINRADDKFNQILPRILIDLIRFELLVQPKSVEEKI